MKKNLLWVAAAIVSCGLAFTSCDVEDVPVAPSDDNVNPNEWEINFFALSQKYADKVGLTISAAVSDNVGTTSIVDGALKEPAADGATTALIEERLSPDIIATDLDGNLDDILIANLRGANIVIHAHGDNIDKIASLTPFFTSVLGTTQAQPVGNLYNFGGFTDGDRALFLAVALGAEEIILAGMDFGDVVTKYSRPNLESDLSKADDFKKKKLMYAEKFTQWIKDNESVKMINLLD